jgi:hypothetical protein
MIDHPGLETCRSDGVEIHTVELNQDILLTLELTQTDRFAGGTGQGEVRGWLPNLHGLSQGSTDE